MTTRTRENLLQAATRLMLEKGYNGTTVDQICSAAGTTKGAFFHHFKNKDHLGLATLDRYADRIFAVMEEGAQRRADQPLARIFDYVDALSQITSKDPDRRPACLLAIETMELGAVHDAFRQRCEHHFGRWTDFLEGLLTEAIASLGHPVSASPRDLAQHFISVFEGSLLLARATSDRGIVERNLKHYGAYLEMVLAPTVTH